MQYMLAGYLEEAPDNVAAESREAVVSDRLAPYGRRTYRAVWNTFDHDKNLYKKFWQNERKIVKLYNNGKMPDRKTYMKFFKSYSPYGWVDYPGASKTAIARFNKWWNMIDQVYPGLNHRSHVELLRDARSAHLHPSVVMATFMAEPEKYVHNGILDQALYTKARKLAANFKIEQSEGK